jgi:flagellar basal-body rod modification protein FlgD
MFPASGITNRFSATQNNNSTSGTDSTSNTKKTSTVDPNDLANKEVFLQLLIAQIKNQDPTKPGDSIQYLTQLSQFTGVEQMVDIKNQLKDLSEKMFPSTTTESGS